MRSASGLSYTITDLGTLSGGGYSIGYGINGSGQVAGASPSQVPILDYDGNIIGYDVYEHAFRWTGGASPTLLDLGTFPGGQNSTAYAINGTGQVAGSSTGFDSTQMVSYEHAFRWTLGSGMLDLGTLGGSSYASALNYSGDAAGYCTTGGGQYRAFFWQDSNGNGQSDPGEMRDLGALPGGSISFAYGINDSDQVVGSSTTLTPAGVQQHAFLWRDTNGNGAPDPGEMRDLGTLPSRTGSVAYAINASGQVAGYSSTADGVQHAVRWSSAGAALDLGTLTGGKRSIAYALNDNGDAVGYSTSSTGALRAILYSNATRSMVDLNTCLDAASRSAWDLRTARGINNTGRITGWGLHNGQKRAFLLTPR